MYVLTIVYLTSQVLVQSVYLNRDWCEEAARFALGFDSGSQAVQSARCDAVPTTGNEKEPRPSPEEALLKSWRSGRDSNSRTENANTDKHLEAVETGKLATKNVTTADPEKTIPPPFLQEGSESPSVVKGLVRRALTNPMT